MMWMEDVIEARTWEGRKTCNCFGSADRFMACLWQGGMNM